MHTVFALLCFVVVIHWLISPYPSGLLHWHCGNLTIAPVPVKQPWWIWINISCEFLMNDCITTTKQSTTKPCAYFLGYTVLWDIPTRLNNSFVDDTCKINYIFNNQCLSQLLWCNGQTKIGLIFYRICLYTTVSKTGGRESILKVDVINWRSTWRQFLRAKTICWGDVTKPVRHVLVRSQYRIGWWCISPLWRNRRYLFVFVSLAI